MEDQAGFRQLFTFEQIGCLLRRWKSVFCISTHCACLRRAWALPDSLSARLKRTVGSALARSELGGVSLEPCSQAEEGQLESGEGGRVSIDTLGDLMEREGGVRTSSGSAGLAAREAPLQFLLSGGREASLELVCSTSQKKSDPTGPHAHELSLNNKGP